MSSYILSLKHQCCHIPIPVLEIATSGEVFDLGVGATVEVESIDHILSHCMKNVPNICIRMCSYLLKDESLQTYHDSNWVTSPCNFVPARNAVSFNVPCGAFNGESFSSLLKDFFRGFFRQILNSALGV
jgi:hypothetical protein